MVGVCFKPCPPPDEGVPGRLVEKGDSCCAEQHTALPNAALCTLCKLKSGAEESAVIQLLSPRGPALVFGSGGWG